MRRDDMNSFEEILRSGDLRSIGQGNKVVSLVNDQESFDELFQLLYHSDRKVIMRAADAIEKITRSHVEYLRAHKNEILALCDSAKHIELKWHLALIVPRVSLAKKELAWIWTLLTNWATDKKESKIVRVNSLQGLFNLLSQHPQLTQDFETTLAEVRKDNIPSLNARIKKLKHLGD